MSDEEYDEELTIDDPLEMLKGALAWLPRQNLYDGILEMLDFMVRGEDGDEVNMSEILNVLFCSAVMGKCFHPAPKPKPLTEDDIQAFMDKLGIDPDEEA